MSFNFTEEFKLNGAAGGVFTFYKKGFKLGGVTSPSFIDVILSGVSSLTLEKAISLNYVKLFGGTEQRNLPAGYTQLEYIETSGTQYINTGAIPIATDNISLDVEFVTVTGGTSVAGARDVGSVGAGVNFGIGATSFTMDFFGSRYTLDNTPVIGSRYRYEVVSKVGSIYKDGVSLGSNTFGATGSLTLPLILGGLNNAGNIGASSGASYKIYGMTIEGKLNLIPCRRNSDSVLGMYDTVTDTFLTNAGTGTFTAGADAVPSPDNPMDIWCNNGKIKAGNIYNVATMGTVLDVSLANTKGDNKIFWNSGSSSVAMPCLPNTTYTASLNGTFEGTIFRIASVDKQITVEDKEGYEVSAINRTPVDNTLTITTGSNDAYIYVQFSSSSIENMKQILQVATQGQIYVDGTVEAVEITGKNLFDVSTMLVTDSFVRAGNVTEENPLGSVVSNDSYSCSDYIKVLPSTSYTTTIPYYTTAGGAGLVFYTNNTIESAISGVTMTQQGGTTYTFTTPATCNYIRFSWQNNNGNNAQLEQGSTATTYEPYTVLGTATAEKLLKVGDYQDEQSVLDGEVTRNVGIKVLDGSEDWIAYLKADYSQFYCMDIVADVGGASGVGFCTHFKYQYLNQSGSFYFKNSAPYNLYVILEQGYDLTTFKQFLADQYANGTPVVIVYPLAEPTTGTVTAQPLSVQTGTNIVTITQASIDDLEMEVSFKQSL